MVLTFLLNYVVLTWSTITLMTVLTLLCGDKKIEKLWAPGIILSVKFLLAGCAGALAQHRQLRL